MLNVQIIKKNGSTEDFDPHKIIAAISKSADRALVTLNADDKNNVVSYVENALETLGYGEISVEKVHKYVEQALDEFLPEVADSYRSYRDYKKELQVMMNEVFDETDTILLRGDNALDSDKVDQARKENGNKDAALVATQQSLTRSAFSKQYYYKTFLTQAERQANDEGYIYIHDSSDRIYTMNCCLFDVANVLKDGFEMGNVWYNEPKTLDVAFDVIGDIVLSAASQQYGGFTLPRVDTLLARYAQKTYDANYREYCNKYYNMANMLNASNNNTLEKMISELARKDALADVERDFEQGFQGWEYKFNTVASSRGDYPFVTLTSGLDQSEFGIMSNVVMYRVHMKGQGKKGHKKPVLFPKYVMLYDKNINGPGTEVFEAALACSAKTMYPDWLSLTGKGYVPSMYKKYGKVISPMGCRAFLSPWYERGGMTPADEDDVPVYEGRFNCGAISLNLPLIYLKAKALNADFYQELDYYLEMIRNLHKRTYAFLGNKMASINPLGFCFGGFYGGNLDFNQKLKESDKILPSSTWSFGITALNELQTAYNGKSLVEDGEFALNVMKYINDKTTAFKNEDHMLYAIYGTPAESLCGKQIKQMRSFVEKHVEELKMVGYDVQFNTDKQCYVIPNVCDRDYVSNSFHCGVWEDISPIVKQNLEDRFWNLHNGGKIQYCRYPVGYNIQAMKSIVLRGMDMGFYEGVNLSMNYCDDCGYEELDMDDVCPVCGSKNITKIDRMNGYLSYTRVHGDTRLNQAKMAEIHDRKSM